VTVKLARVKDTGAFETWTEKDIGKYRKRHKLGTRARLALLYGTMQRRGDVVLLGRQHITNGILSLRQQTTGAQVDVPVLPDLQSAIDAMPKAAHLTFLVTEFGKPFTAAGFGNWFREQCELAGVPKNLSTHGLRKAGTTRLAVASERLRYLTSMTDHHQSVTHVFGINRNPCVRNGPRSSLATPAGFEPATFSLEGW